MARPKDYLDEVYKLEDAEETRGALRRVGRKL
jgi:hypothetical protein